jgi:hypothetical protein
VIVFAARDYLENLPLILDVTLVLIFLTKMSFDSDISLPRNIKINDRERFWIDGVLSTLVGKLCMHFLETRDGHRFPIEQLTHDFDSSSVDVRPAKKSDFEWFTSHSYRFEIMVWEDEEHAFTLTGCQTKFELSEYEQGTFVARIEYEEIIPKR